MSDYSAILAKLVACGLNASGLSVAEAEDMPATIEISSATSVTEKNFRCIYDARITINLAFRNSNLDRAYDQYREDRFDHDRREFVTEWLKNNNRFTGAPILQGKAATKSWAAAVERHCGVHEGKAIEFVTPDLIALRKEFDAIKPSFAQECLWSVIFLSDLRANGLEFTRFPSGTEEK